MRAILQTVAREALATEDRGAFVRNELSRKRPRRSRVVEGLGSWVGSPGPAVSALIRV